MDMNPILTVGYGKRTLAEFVELLQQHDTQFLIDVRSRPYSKYRPEFSKDALDEALRRVGIQYVFLGDKLGGIPEDEACLTDGKVDYEKCRVQSWFLEGLERLRTAWEKKLNVVLMCAEGKPENCHRSKLIGTSLVDASIDVLHIDENGALLEQKDVVRRLTGGQLELFGTPVETQNSRKRYSTNEDPDDGEA